MVCCPVLCCAVYLISSGTTSPTAAAGVESCQGPAGYDAYRYAQLLLQTRAFKLPTGPVLCPLIDLTNHLSVGANARTKLEGGGVHVGGNDNVIGHGRSSRHRVNCADDEEEQKNEDKAEEEEEDRRGASHRDANREGGGNGEGGSMLVLRATRALRAGEEVFKNYDTEADYSDLFERYGFLDETASLHTAEVGASVCLPVLLSAHLSLFSL